MSFEFEFTQQKLAEMVPGNPYIDHWYEAIAEILPEYEINTPARVAMFIAQCAHESGGFRAIKENLNYRAPSLRKLFPKYFPDDALAARYASLPNKQAAIANRIYANRMGNGDEASGDGWKYRGRGIVQLTGKANYTAFSHDVFGDDHVVENPDLVAHPEYAVLSACWFWKKNNLNQWCDAGDIVTLSKRINGGTIGLDDRKKHYEHAKHVLA
jgi:putative chitinase